MQLLAGARPLRAILAPAVLAALGVALALAGCGETADTGAPPATTSPPATTAVGDTPPARVQRTRGAIVTAARSFDYEALGALLDPKTFSYSFGERGDPLGYWRRLEEGHTPVLGEILPAVLATTPARRDDMYVWPAAYATHPDDWTARDIDEMRTLHSEEEIEAFRAAGAYQGWRAGIRADGTWAFFIAGD